MKFIPKALSQGVAVTALKVSKHSPTLLFAGGVVGIVGTVVLASRATLKLPEILEDTNRTLNDIETVIDHPNYSAEDRVKDKALVFTKTVIKIIKLYVPSLALGAVSIGMLAGSHNILSRRNAALTAAYAAVEKAFRGYRDRVIEDLGEDKDRQYRYGLETAKVVETDENGKKTQVEKLVPTDVSEYGRLFREGNPNWQSNPMYNYFFLRAVQNHANDKLQSKGFVLLNDIYDDLGFDRTPAGCVVGWLANGKGDGYIDFGVFDDKDELRIHNYISGHEGELVLDFNVDGTVYDKI